MASAPSSPHALAAQPLPARPARHLLGTAQAEPYLARASVQGCGLRESWQLMLKTPDETLGTDFLTRLCCVYMCVHAACVCVQRPNGNSEFTP